MKRKTKEEFIQQAIQIHGNKYDYSKVNYINRQVKVKIFCNTCKEYFWQLPQHHLNNHKGCPKCQKHSKKQIVFKNEIKALYGNKYTVKGKYKGSKIKILMHCNTCNKDFLKMPQLLLHKNSGCPYCKPVSKGEEYIKNWLLNNNISFVWQHRFKDCRDKTPF